MQKQAEVAKALCQRTDERAVLLARAGMPERRHTSLLRGEGGLMRIVTVWRSRDHLDRYLAGVDKPFAVGLLESAGGETVVDVLDLVMDSNTAWWP